MVTNLGHIKRIRNILALILLTSTYVVLAFAIFLQFEEIQTYVVKGLLKKFCDQKNVAITFESCSFDVLGGFGVKNVVIKDHHQDTLIYVNKLRGDVNHLKTLLDKKVYFDKIVLQDGFVKSIKYQNDDLYSLSVFSNKLKSKKKSQKKLRLNIYNAYVDNVRYVMINHDKKVVDFNHINGQVQKIYINGSNVYVDTDGLAFTDVYGLHYEKLKAKYLYTPNGMSFKDVNIVTANSNIGLDLRFIYRDANFKNFVENVHLKGVVYPSEISSTDIAHFYKWIAPHKKIKTNFKIDGCLNDFKLKKVWVRGDDGLELQGDFRCKNTIHDVENVFLQSKNIDVKLNALQIKSYTPINYQSKIPKDLKGLENFHFVGGIEIFKNLQKIKGDFESNIVRAFVNTTIKHNTPQGVLFNYEVNKAVLQKKNLIKDLNQLEFSSKGSLSYLNQKIKGISEGDLKLLGYKKMTFRNTSFKIAIADIINLDLSSNDSILAYDAHLSYQNQHPIKNIKALCNIKKGKLNKIFPEQVKYQEQISGILDVDALVAENSMKVKAGVNDMLIKTIQDNIYVPVTNIDFQKSGKVNTLDVNADQFLNLYVHGGFDVTDLEKLTKNVIYKFIPGQNKRNQISNQDILFKLNASPFLVKTFTKSFKIDENIEVVGEIKSDNDLGYLNASIPKLSYGAVKVEGLKMVFNNANTWLNTNISSKTVRIKEQEYKDISFLGKKVNDTLYLRSNFQGDKLNNLATFYVVSTKENQIGIGVEDLKLSYGGLLWNNNKFKQNLVTYDVVNKNWNFNELSFVNNFQKIELNGTTKKEARNLTLTFSNVLLDKVLPEIKTLNMKGAANGILNFIDTKNGLQPNGMLKVSDFTLNDVVYGDLSASIIAGNANNSYTLGLNLQQEGRKLVVGYGDITLDYKNIKNSVFNLQAIINDLKLNSLSPLGKDVLSKIRGVVAGNILLSGKLNDLEMFGDLYVMKAGLHFPYLNTDYNIEDGTKVVLKGKSFVVNNASISDSQYNTKGNLTGAITFDNFNNWALDLRVDSKNLLALNTKPNLESLYYGTGFFKGYTTIAGPTSDIKINVVGATLPGTKFVLPLSDVAKAEDNKFVFFKNDIETSSGKNIEQKNTSQSSVTVTLNLDITKDAIGEVVIDQANGSSLSGSTEGKLLIEIDRYFNINMYGDLTVEQGTYNYKYGGIINKPFVVKKGGLISWNGDPYKANLDIDAVHSIKANPKILLENIAVNKKIDVDLITKITGELFDSKQVFNFQFPGVSQQISQELDFKLNVDENIKMRQFFSLLVSKSFYDENNNDSNTSSVLSSTTSELVSRVVTDMFNKEGDKFHLDFGYTAGESATIDKLSIDNQIDIGVETEINDRIIINGKLGVPVGSVTQSGVVGQLKIEFLINEDGSLRSTVFNRQNEIQFTQEEEGYTQGLGLNYQVDFSSIRETIKNLWYRRKQKKNKKAAAIEYPAQENIILDAIN